MFAEIVNERGKALNRVYDFRTEGEPEHGFTNQERVVSELIYGATGLLEVLGIKKIATKRISWKNVREIRDGKIIIVENDEMNEP